MVRGLILVAALGGLIICSTFVEGPPYDYGVCYGTQGDNLPQPSQVVHLFQRKRISYMMLHNPNPAALNALMGSEIGVIVGIPNDMIRTIASYPDAASGWLQLNILPYRSDVFFGYIAVGNEAIPGDHAQYVLPAMKNLDKAMVDAGIEGQIRMTTAVGMSILGKSHPPSAAAFSSESMQYMKPIVEFLNSSIGGPLLANVYPYYAYAANPKYTPLEYALFTAHGTVVQDGRLSYQNLFHAMTDALFWALEKVGGSEVGIIVSETGWPTAGGVAATIENARIYNSNLIKHAGLGTPKVPSNILDFYISSIFDENLKRPQGVANHFGLFYNNLQPVYSINFTN